METAPDRRREVIDRLLMQVGLTLPEEREAALAVLDQCQAFHMDPFQAIHALRTPPEFEETPVDVVTFIEDEYFLNLKGQVWPKIIDDLGEFFEGGNYVQAVLKGAIGWGKTTFAELALLKMLHDMGCLRDPQRHMGMIRGSHIAFGIVSVNKTQAERVLFSGIKAKVRHSPYFRERFPYDPHIKSELRYPKEIWLAPLASNEGNVLGLNLFGGVMDESNWMPVVERSKQVRSMEVYDKARELHNQMERRLQNRFMVQGKVFGKIMVISSSRYPDDFTDRKALEARDDPTIFVRQYAPWDTKPAHFFLPTRFKVEIGDEVRSSRILQAGDQPRPGAQVIEVPDDYRRAFELDPDGAVREIAGRPVAVIEPFIRRRELIVKCVDPDRVHPFPSVGLTSGMEKSVIRELLCEEIEGSWRPRFHPLAIRSAHVDLALNGDACGVAVGCSPGKKDVLRMTPDKEMRIEVAPVIWYDLLMQIKAPPGGEIDIAEVRNFLIWLATLGFRLRRVTYDGFESAESIQQLQKKHIESYRLSVDKTMEAYESLKAAIYEERASYYEMPIVLKELRTLMVDRKRSKIDHPPLGSKDVTDGMAGVAHHWTVAPIGDPLMPSPGIKEDVIVGLGISKEDYEWMMQE